MPPTQKKEKRQKGETYIPHAQFVADVSEGITKILSSDRIPTRESKKDLLRCIELLVSTDPQPFEWNIDMYTDERKTPQEQVTLNLFDDPDRIDVSSAPELEHKEHFEDDEGVKRPAWILDSYYLVRLDCEPFWGIAKYVVFM